MKVGDLVYHRDRGRATSWINDVGIVVNVSRVSPHAALINVHWAHNGIYCGYRPYELRLLDESR